MKKQETKRENEKMEGRVVPNNTEPLDLLEFFEQRSRFHAEEKRQMAEMAAELLPEKTTVFADASTTVMQVLMLLQDRGETTVLTNSIPALTLLHQSALNIISTGGASNKISCSLQGFIARNAILNFQVEYMLTSCRELKFDDGAYDSKESETELKRLMARQAAKIIMIADHSKFDRISLVKYCSFDQIYMLITDRKPTDEWLKMLERHNVRVCYPEIFDSILADPKIS